LPPGEPEVCGRIVQASGPLHLAIVEGIDVPLDDRGSNLPRRYNGAPAQDLLVIRENHKTGERSLGPLRWGLIPNWSAERGRQPINARAETLATTPTFRDAYRLRRCIVPVDAFFEWQATKSGKQPYAIAMKAGSPFGLAGLWENWRNPETGEWERTFTIITVPSNDLIAQIHDRMPAILRQQDYLRWLGEEPDPHDLLRTFPPEPMRMWPISRRANKPENDDPTILDPVELAAGVA
jgi:putative SOS response-associated peptidase YedK